MARYSRFNHTSRDYDSAIADLKDRILQKITDWTDHSAANPGMAIAELQAFLFDEVSYYQDRLANEAFGITAFERQNLIRHAKWIGYTMATAAPATTVLHFELKEPATAAVVIDQGDPIYTPDGRVRFEATERVEIAAGDTEVDVDGIEGETVAEDLGTGDGEPEQTFQLAQVPFIAESETVTVDGIIWTRVDDLLSSGGSDQHYTVEVDAFDQATVRFGDGVNGAAPPIGAPIAASYRIGGGEVGNVEAGTLTRLGRSYTAADGTPVNLTVTNPEKASDGEDRETEAHAKLYGPKSLATGNRSVSKEDFETNAELVPGVARALAQTVDDDPAINENTVLVQVVPTGSGTPTEALLDAVEVQLTTTTPKTITSRLMVVQALYTDIAMVGTVYVAKGESGQPPLLSRIEEVADAVLALLEDHYDAEHIDVETGGFTIGFGDLVALSSHYRLLTTPEGVKRADITSPVANQQLDPKRFPRLRARTRAVLTSPDRVEFTWTGLGTKLVFQAEP